MNNTADLSDVKTAITNGQQRAANVKYHSIVNGYQAALQVVDDVVLKNYNFTTLAACIPRAPSVKS